MTAKPSLNESNYDGPAGVPEFGDNLAGEIMMFRTRHGKIKDRDDLLEIPGFTPMLIEDLKKHELSL